LKRNNGSPVRRAVVLAGGVGSRLNPYTTVIPKPLLPIGDRAILDILVRQLAAAGFTDLTFAVGYLSYLIEAIFGDGSNHGVVIDYHHEDTPRGTVGALTDIDRLDEPFLVINGDVLTTLDYQALYESHIKSENLLTIATHHRTICTEYGVLSLTDSSAKTSSVVGYDEKPKLPFTVSMGVYVMNHSVLDYIPQGGRFDIPDLVHHLIAAGEQVGSYRYTGYWLDIGRHEDYQKAIADFSKREAMLVPGPEPRVNGRGPSQNARAANQNGRGPSQNARAANQNGRGPSQNARAANQNGRGPSQNGRAASQNGRTLSKDPRQPRNGSGGVKAARAAG
jgi:NDP-sugar pyrophosphorylase family protein